ncbi:unnamed protein product [Brassica rapa]|uniref:BnaA08g04970D protein n=2 Tax=Brassica TaxID=3705 RepID=A0A078HA66_BRANA|nr:unnamed protein product [Brassica rapa]CDY34542.1 BnaA08g04970D [Brassica napus]VDD03248.1 unnamed protein product [Brassica rapa]
MDEQCGKPFTTRGRKPNYSRRKLSSPHDEKETMPLWIPCSTNATTPGNFDRGRQHHSRAPPLHREPTTGTDTTGGNQANYAKYKASDSDTDEAMQEVTVSKKSATSAILKQVFLQKVLSCPIND